MPTPVVSVILPTYGRTDILGESIQSVLAQTFDAWELLVVDDASEVAVEPIVSGFGDPRLRYVRRPVNGGVAAAQNTGLDHTRGEYVAFLHSDDRFLPKKLEGQVALFETLPDTVGAVEAGVEVVWRDHVEHWAPALPHATWTDLLAYRTHVHIAGLVVRRELAQALRFDEQLRGVEDRDFCIRLLQATDVVGHADELGRISKLDARLGQQDKAPIYEYLLGKYADAITRDRRVHADWYYRIARAHARAGNIATARRALRRSARLDPWRARRWALWLASFGGDRLTAEAFDGQKRAAGAVERFSRGRSDPVRPPRPSRRAARSSAPR